MVRRSTRFGQRCRVNDDAQMGYDGDVDSWSATMKDLVEPIVEMLVVAALIVDVLVAIEVWDFVWGDHAEWLWRALSCAVLPINVVTIGFFLSWLLCRHRNTRR